MNIRYIWKNYPVITILLVALNGLLFLGPDLFGIPASLEQVLLGGSVTLWDIENGAYYRILTAMSLHFDINHLMGNMLILAVLGYRLETILGHVPYLILYLVSGVGANMVTFFSYWLQGDYLVLSAGASGAIFGVCGGMFAVALAGREAAGITSRQMLLLILLTLFSGYMSAEVNNLAHLSGLLFGILLGLAFYLIGQGRSRKIPGCKGPVKPGKKSEKEMARNEVLVVGFSVLRYDRRSEASCGCNGMPWETRQLAERRMQQWNCLLIPLILRRSARPTTWALSAASPPTLP